MTTELGPRAQRELAVHVSVAWGLAGLLTASAAAVLATELERTSAPVAAVQEAAALAPAPGLVPARRGPRVVVVRRSRAS